jgi:HlyD family secretion protein
MNTDESKAEAKTAEEKFEGKAPDAKADTKPEPKADAKPDPAVEQKAAAKPEAKDLQPKTEGKGPEPRPEAKAPGAGTDVKAVQSKTGARNKVLFGVSIVGVLAGLVAAYVFGRQGKSQPPVFQPVSSPYDTAIYADGIIESDQSNGSNVNIYPEVSGPVTQVLVHEGQEVAAGTTLLTIDDSVQRANTEQLRLQSEAAKAVLEELRAEPRAETLAIANAQVDLARTGLKSARDQDDKDRASYAIDPKSISKDVLDTADDAVRQAAAGLEVAGRQFELIRAGAWSYDIANQEKQYRALRQAYKAADALLQKFSIKAPAGGIVLSIYAAVGSYVSSQGSYDPYTEGYDQLLIMGPPQDYLAVRCYVDEILISRLPSKWHIRAQMSVTGTDIKVPLEFVRVQPYVSPKIELSNQRQEKVDLRVLPVIFRFEKKDIPVYPGQLVDVYIGTQ